jgi:hypothetical protein
MINTALAIYPLSSINAMKKVEDDNIGKENDDTAYSPRMPG